MLESMAALVPALVPPAAALALGGAELHADVAAFIRSFVEELGPEMLACRQMVYLVTISRVLPEALSKEGLRDVTLLSRAEVAGFLRDALDAPVAQRGGDRPVRRGEASAVDKMVVYETKHHTGEAHWHVAI